MKILFITADKLCLYHNFMLKQDVVGSHPIGFRLVAQLKSTRGGFYTIAFADSIEEALVWADLNNITLNVE